VAFPALLRELAEYLRVESVAPQVVFLALLQERVEYPRVAFRLARRQVVRPRPVAVELRLPLQLLL
jgi:hypothetical protein